MSSINNVSFAGKTFIYSKNPEKLQQELEKTSERFNGEKNDAFISTDSGKVNIFAPDAKVAFLVHSLSSRRMIGGTSEENLQKLMHSKEIANFTEN